MDLELIRDYEIRPVELARTLTQFWNGTSFATATAAGETPLFSLRRDEDDQLVLEWPLGRHCLVRAEVERVTPDPLWESVSGICRHMEEDHADTFPEFLRCRGWSTSAPDSMVMPWVEKRGFFLSSPECLAWIPFPQECPTPNEVRKALIKMLREIRGD